jgi:hypothetical protein
MRKTFLISTLSLMLFSPVYHTKTIGNSKNTNEYSVPVLIIHTQYSDRINPNDFIDPLSK